MRVAVLSYCWEHGEARILDLAGERSTVAGACGDGDGDAAYAGAGEHGNGHGVGDLHVVQGTVVMDVSVTNDEARGARSAHLRADLMGVQRVVPMHVWRSRRHQRHARNVG